MSELINSKSIVTSMLKHPVVRFPMEVWRVALCGILALAILPTTTFAQSPCPGIHVKILDVRNSTGAVACALFEAPEGFPQKFMKFATSITMIKIKDTEARCHFLEVPSGTYALAVIHDENMNGELDTNWLGNPKEGYAFSGEAKGLLGAPSFEDARFSYDGEDLDMTITLNY